ncbi:hypothetical protein CEXT_17661 [Caerostris extrusa]|uniref:Uncharacterized protein n=1 Tax=Caerostris extrusa TaxID=172846 RepID=A0AAV4MSY0_CAEEX|nr:hypothetical protein CEXT_17661 [Caerostris extrusa]
MLKSACKQIPKSCTVLVTGKTTFAILAEAMGKTECLFPKGLSKLFLFEQVCILFSYYFKYQLSVANLQNVHSTTNQKSSLRQFEDRVVNLP